MSVIIGTRENFEQEVLKSDKPVLVDFNASWCGPCKMLSPIVQQLAATQDRFKIVSVNIDDEDILAEDYEVSSIPCLVAFKDGDEVAREVGFRPAELILEMMEGL